MCPGFCSCNPQIALLSLLGVFIQGNMKYNPVTLSLLQTEERRGGDLSLFLQAIQLRKEKSGVLSYQLLLPQVHLRILWGKDSDRDKATWIRQNICWDHLCVPCRAAGVTGPFFLLCLWGLCGKSHLFRYKKIDQYVSAALIPRAAF